MSDTDIFRYLEDLKQKQNNEEVLRRRQAKKRAEVQDRTIETETPSKVKKVEEEKDKKIDDKIGEWVRIIVNLYIHKTTSSSL